MKLVRNGKLQAIVLGGIILFSLAISGARNGDSSLLVGIIGASVFGVLIYFWHKRWSIRLEKLDERKRKLITILFFAGLFVLLVFIATLPSFIAYFTH